MFLVAAYHCRGQGEGLPVRLTFFCEGLTCTWCLSYIGTVKTGTIYVHPPSPPPPRFILGAISSACGPTMSQLWHSKHERRCPTHSLSHTPLFAHSPLRWSSCRVVGNISILYLMYFWRLFLVFLRPFVAFLRYYFVLFLLLQSNLSVYFLFPPATPPLL